MKAGGEGRRGEVRGRERRGGADTQRRAAMMEALNLIMISWLSSLDKCGQLTET